jgi:cyclophilin family peptidyl-prolyl cis-trans isomerase
MELIHIIIIVFLLFFLLYIIFYLKNSKLKKNSSKNSKFKHTNNSKFKNKNCSKFKHTKNSKFKNKNSKFKNKNSKFKHTNNSSKIKNKNNSSKFKHTNNCSKIKKNSKTSIIKHIKKLQKESKQNEVYFTIEVNGEELGNILIKLFENIVPKTCENFKQLCINKKYIDSPFHRIIKDFMIQGGDFTKHNGTGGESIYGNKFPDENFTLKHDKPYLVSMANSGPDTNGSQFFITTSEAPHLDEKHVVFGEIIGGFDLIYFLNNTETDGKDCPINKIVIKDCGVN